jgi:hypothetical protein
MAEMTREEAIKKAAKLYERLSKDPKNEGILRDLGAREFGGGGPSGSKLLKKEGITPEQYVDFIQTFRNFERSQGREFNPYVRRAGPFLQGQASDVGSFIQSLPATQRQPGPRGGQGTRPDQYVPPIAGGGFASLADEFAGNQQFNPRETIMSEAEYPDYLIDLQYANELRQEAGLQPLPVQSIEELNRGLYTANLVGPQGMSRILPTPTEQDGMGYFDDRFAGPTQQLTRAQPSRGAIQRTPSAPAQQDGMGYFGDRFAGPTQEPTRAQPSRGAIQRTPTIPAGVVTPTPAQQVGQAVTAQQPYQSAVQQMIGQAPQPATVNAPQMQVTSPMSGVGATTERTAGQQGRGVGSPTGIASGVQGGAGMRVGTATGTSSAQQPFVPNTEGMGYFMGGSMPNNQLQDQGLARIQQESIAGRIPMAPSEYINTRQQAMRTAMQQGQPMVVSGEFPGMVMIGGTPRGGISSAPISGEGGFDPASARVARAYNQQINQMMAEGRTPTRQEQVDLQRNLLQQERDAQASFEDRFARAQQAGLAAGGGAGNPEDNYNRALADMRKMSGLPNANIAEAREAMSTRGRMEARRAEREQAELERLAAARGGLTPQQQIAENEAARQSAERVAGAQASAKQQEAQIKAEQERDNAIIERSTVINTSLSQRGIGSAVAEINRTLETVGKAEGQKQKDLLNNIDKMQKEPGWNRFLSEMTKAQYYRQSDPVMEEWASKFDNAFRLQGESFLYNMEELYKAWSKS